MPRPKGSKNKTELKSQKFKELSCAACGKIKKTIEFYMSYNPVHQTGRIPYCKECLRKMIADEKGNVTLEKLKKTLQLIDKPFLYDIWKISLEDKTMEPFGAYMKNIQMPQYRDLGWKDSEMLPQVDKELNYDNVSIEQIEQQVDFEVTKEMIIKWGNGFSQDQYMMLEDLYQNLFNSYDIDNRSQEEYLKTACLYQLRNIEAIRGGNAAEATKWGSLFDSYMASGKLKPNQLSESDRMGGVTNFATFFQFVEKSNNFIPTFPDLILDDIDYAIYKFINYNRTLMGLPEIQLGEVKDFMTYDYQKGQEIVFPDLVIDETGEDSDVCI